MFGSKPKEDRVVHSVKRSRIILDACASLSAEGDTAFLDMDLEAKRAWLAKHMDAVIERAVLLGGASYEQLRLFRIFIVENEGHAVLYFERK